MQGPQVAGEIRRTLRQLESEQAGLETELTELTGTIQTLTTERARAYEQLAKTYLPELDRQGAHGALEQLPQMRERIEAVLEERRRELQELSRSIESGSVARHQKEDAVATLTSRIEELAVERDSLRDRVDERLAQDPAYLELQTQTEQLSERLDQSNRRLDAATAERDEKLAAYEQNDLFQYLLGRGYDASEYRGSGLTARLDGWVAGKVDYTEQRKNYLLLREVPEVMQRQVESTGADLQRITQSLEDASRSVEEEVGLTAILKKGADLYLQRGALLEEIHTLDEEGKSLTARRQRTEDLRGEYYERALAEYAQFLQRQDLPRLRSVARATPTPADDGFVHRLEDVEQDLEAARHRVADARSERDAKAGKLQELRGLDGNFHRHDYDASNSEFGQGFDVEKLLEQLVIGAIGAAKVWSAMRGAQRFRRRQHRHGSAVAEEILFELARAGLSHTLGGGGRRSGGGRGRGFGGFGGRRSRTTGGFG